VAGATISLEAIKTLREQTGAGVADCRKALQETRGQMEKAVELLRQRGEDKAAQKAERQTRQGIVDAYIHLDGRIGVLLEVNCETDFVARTEDFRRFVHDVAMQVAAMSPLCVSRAEVPSELAERERQAVAAEVRGKPAPIAERILTGKLEKLYQQVCLLDQAFIKDESTTIGGNLKSLIAKTGENIVIRRFARFQLGG
jgi:elongation factor Ts